MLDEAAIQRAVIQHLKTRKVHGLVWFAVPNGGKRNPIEAAIFKGLGVVAGVADICALHAGKFYALEIKTESGRVSPSQRKFLDDVRDAGGLAEIGRGLDECLQILEGWRLLRGGGI